MGWILLIIASIIWWIGRVEPETWQWMRNPSYERWGTIS
jgi:hypothetical protein